MDTPSFFALIIGTEILNRRRSDKHFDFVSQALLKKSYKLSGSLIIEDDPSLIVQTIRFVNSQPNTALLSFGGIGSTPDDHTRKCAASALRDGKLYLHDEAKKIISSKIDVEKYPHSLNMAMLPHGATLLENPVNKMPAFSLDSRYFFMPGFPEMSHPMVDNILSTCFSEGKPIYRYTLTALCREGELISVMKQMPKGVEFSSLPKLMSDGWQTTISVASADKNLVQMTFKQFTSQLDQKNIYFALNE
ncbi:MAG: competence/damage-inducible protein A [Sulfurovum sp.]|nr:competence/damage-inducible protein A [Sulfurovum sp.]